MTEDRKPKNIRVISTDGENVTVDSQCPSATDAIANFHPFARFMDACADLIEAPEFVVDNTIVAGTAVIAGERGLGKTSFLVPLFLCATGLLSDYPLHASVRRRVVYVTEDIGQVRRIIGALRVSGRLPANSAAINDWFRVVEAKRLTADQIASVVSQYDDLYTPNERADGSIYDAPPAVVLDTTNATINLENPSSNAEVSSAVATLRQAFGAIPLCLIGHVSKASRSDVQQLSFVGAGAWEGDTQQTLYLTSDRDHRYLSIGKRRFETDIVEFEIVGCRESLTAVDKLGRHTTIDCFYSLPVAYTQTTREQREAERQRQARQAEIAAKRKSLVVYIHENPGANQSEVTGAVKGQKSALSSQLSALVREGYITSEKGAKGSICYRVVMGTADREFGLSRGRKTC